MDTLTGAVNKIKQNKERLRIVNNTTTFHKNDLQKASGWRQAGWQFSFKPDNMQSFSNL